MDAIEALRDKRGSLLLLTEQQRTVGPLTCEVCNWPHPGGVAVGVIVFEEHGSETPWLLWLLPDGWSVTDDLAGSMAVCASHQVLQGIRNLHPHHTEEATPGKVATRETASPRITSLGFSHLAVSALLDGRPVVRRIRDVINPGDLEPSVAAKLVGRDLAYGARAFYQSIALPQQLLVRDDVGTIWAYSVTVGLERLADDQLHDVDNGP